jgi:hypothetical protein
MPRRLATLSLLAFFAAPVMNVECLLSCLQANIVTASATCHQSTEPDAVISSGGQDCTNTQAVVSPYLKANEQREAALIVPSFRANPRSAVHVVLEPSAIEPGTGPPDVPSSPVPLRI